MKWLKKLKKGLYNPEKAWNEVNRRYEDSINTIRGINYVEQDWDNLILLDGCRFDLFEEYNNIEGELSAARSNSSTSQDFFRKNFHGGEFPDIVYYSANPHIDKYNFSLHQIFGLWETDFDSEIGTVLPSDAVDRVLDTEAEFRDKRLVIHLMQPHRPFLGDRASKFEQSGFSAKGVNMSHDESPDTPMWWSRLEKGELSHDEVWALYRDTLQIALPQVQRLVDNLPGKSVVSADHGNAFGEDEIYGHPGRTSHKTLTNVPWLEIDKPRKTVSDGIADVKTKREHFLDAENQLKALGYK